MIRLNLSREPSWLDLGHDVRVRVAPLTTSLMAAARSDPAVAALPEGASNETIAVTMAKALARLVVLEWEGVGDAEGNPVAKDDGERKKAAPRGRQPAKKGPAAPRGRAPARDAKPAEGESAE